jgi:hypothetical protein
MAAEGDEIRIELTDLDVISRYSLAVRHATANRDDLIATLRSDLEWLESLGVPARRVPAAAPRKAAAKKVAKKAASRR